MDFKDLAPYQLAFSNYLEDQELKLNQPKNLYEPIDYIMSLGGKKIRPVLTLISYQLFAVDFEKALSQALAIETFHNFTLMHDDIMDQAPTRRGQESVHRSFGLNAAILSGDAMVIMAYQYLITGMEPEYVPRGVDMFSHTALEICKGQQLDMDFEKREVVEIEEYLEMIRQKTAVLLGLSMSLGALVAGADTKSVEALKRCGEAAGMAFQIHDDYLDAFGDVLLTGKQRGGDIIQNKKTYLWLKACDLGGERIKRELLSMNAHPDIDPKDKVRRVLEIYQSLGIEEHCKHQQQEYVNLAIDALNEVAAEDAAKQRIFDLMALLLGRQH